MEPKESPYYYGNCDCPPTILTLKSHGAPVVTLELPWDVSTQDMCHAFFAAMVGVTFDPTDVLECMKEYAEEHLPDNKEEEP